MLARTGASAVKRLSRVRAMTAAALISLAAAAYAMFNRSLLGDGDTSWHIATGRWILANRAVPDHDPFSFSMPGAEWHAHEWLAEIPMTLAYDAGGWPAVLVLFSAVFGVTLFLIGRELSRHLPLRWMVAVLAGLFTVMLTTILARPHVLAWPLMAGWLILLLHARERRRAPPLAAALLMVVWTNLHASYIVGLGLVGVFALEALVEDRDPRRSIPQWAVFGLTALAAACVTPHGIQGFLYPFQVSGMQVLTVIQEWRPTKLGTDNIFLSYMVAVSGLALLSWRHVGPVRLVLLAGLGWMAIEHVRHQTVFALVTVLAVVPRAAIYFTKRVEPEPGQRLPWREAAWFGAAFAVLAGIRLMVPVIPDKGPSYMGKAFEAVPPALRSKPVLNSYSFGGPLILRGVPVFIDGRADMYGDAFTLNFDRISDGDIKAFRKAVERYDLRWTILGPEDKLVGKLDREPGWKRLYKDKFATVHVRVSGAPK